MRIRPARRIDGRVCLPGDKSISHRAALIAALATGSLQISNFSTSQDCAATLACLKTLGVAIHTEGPNVQVEGVGRSGLRSSREALDCGNSGSTMRMLAGVLAGQNFTSTLTGDGSLRSRPMTRIVEPLEMMGARVLTQNGKPPLAIQGTASLQPIRYELPVASAQVKSCILLAGLQAEGPAALLPGSDLEIDAVGLNPTRTQFLLTLRSLGVDLDITQDQEDCNEPVGMVHVTGKLIAQSARLQKSNSVEGRLIPQLIDELPLLAVVGTQITGGIHIHDAGELRLKESDRIKVTVKNLRAMGAEVEEFADGLSVAGPTKLRGAKIDSSGDHRIAMAFAVAGLIAEGDSEIEDAECINVSFPEFFTLLESIVER